MTRVLGIDVGGAVSVHEETGELLELFDMPKLNDGPRGRPTINPVLLFAIISKSGAARAFVEFVGPRPREGSVQSFSFGRAKGQVEMACAALNIPIVWLTAPVWKRTVGIPPGTNKDLARSEAIKRWPAKAELFKYKKDHNRAEAALIAVAGIRRERGNKEEA
jgi:crossover junction endodeoxyribonuclease RuvC